MVDKRKKAAGREFTGGRVVPSFEIDHIWTTVMPFDGEVPPEREVDANPIVLRPSALAERLFGSQPIYMSSRVDDAAQKQYFDTVHNLRRMHRAISEYRKLSAFSRWIPAMVIAAFFAGILFTLVAVKVMR